MTTAKSRAPGNDGRRSAAAVGAFVDYGVARPAFPDCAQALMRRSGPELLDEISESALFGPGRGISSCLAITAILDDGNAAGEFEVSSPTLLANMLYASGLGALQPARVGILITRGRPHHRRGLPRPGARLPGGRRPCRHQVRATGDAVSDSAQVRVSSMSRCICSTSASTPSNLCWGRSSRCSTTTMRWS